MTIKEEDAESTKKLSKCVLLMAVLILMVVVLSGVAFGVVNFSYHVRIEKIERGVNSTYCITQTVNCSIGERFPVSCSTNPVPINITVSIYVFVYKNRTDEYLAIQALGIPISNSMLLHTHVIKMQ